MLGTTLKAVYISKLGGGERVGVVLLGGSIYGARDDCGYVSKYIEDS